MKRFFRWKGFLILFLITAVIALLSFYSCKKGSQSHTDPFAEPKKANVTLREFPVDSNLQNAEHTAVQSTPTVNQ